MSIRYTPRNSIGKSYRLHSKNIDSIGFTYRILRYIMDRQNYIGFTYKSPINLLYLFTVYGSSFSNCLFKKIASQSKCCNVAISRQFTPSREPISFIWVFPEKWDFNSGVEIFQKNPKIVGFIFNQKYLFIFYKRSLIKE